MCGLVGVVGQIFDPEKKAFETMLKFDIERGPHSTGVLQVTKGNETILIKDEGNTYDMLYDNYDLYYNTQPNVAARTPLRSLRVMMGHNRWATVGKVNKANAHPFEAGNIIGAHNGTIPEFRRKQLEDWDQFETDSEALMHNFNKRGVKETLSSITGAWALTWWDKRDNTFNMLRNNERPLFYAFTENAKTLVYASEKWMIQVACERHNVKITEINKFVENKHFKFFFDDAGIDSARIETTEVKEWVYTHRYSSNTNYNHVFNQVTGPTQKVVPFQKKSGKTFSETASSFKEAKLLEDKRVVFYIENDFQKGKYGHPYIRGWEGKTNVEVRIYIQEGDKGHEALVDMLGDMNNLSFVGTVRKIKMENGEPYALLRMDTIIVEPTTVFSDQKPNVNDVIDQISKREQEWVTVNGGRVTRELYDDLTKCGCSWCGTIPQPAESKTLHWIDNRTFVCDDCSVNNPYIKNYGLM